MSNFAAITSYFETVATQLLAISHDAGAALARFGTYDPDEVLTGLRRKLDVRGSHLVLLIEKPTTSYDNNGADGPYTEHRMGFVLVRQCLPGDFAAQKQAEDDAHTAGQQIGAKIRTDARAWQFLTDTAQLTNNEQFLSEFVGPAFDECYGARFEFSWCEPGGLKVDPEAWAS